MTRILAAGSSERPDASPRPESRLAPFKGRRVLSLESYKKNGVPKRTPVIFIEDDGKLYFQTAVNAWKAKRVLRNPRVLVAPSTFRGEAKGEWIAATVTRVDEEDAKRIRRAFDRKFGFFSRVTFFLERIAWGKIAFFSISTEPNQHGIGPRDDQGLAARGQRHGH